jgi:hypothetical protein
MGHRRGFRRWGVLCCTLGVVVGTVLLVAPAGAAPLSEDDCETLIAGQANSGQSSANDNQENLAAQADAFSDTAADLSDKKVKAALLRLADVYDDASKAKSVAGSSLILSERAKDYAKGYKVYAKSLNQCMVRSLPSVPAR